MNAEECKCTKLQSKQMGDKESLSKKRHMFSQLHWDFFVRKVQLLEESRKLKCLIENEAGEIKFLHLLTRIDLKGIRDVCIFLRDSSERKVTQSDFWSFLWSWAWIAKVSKLFWEHTVFENHSKKSQITILPTKLQFIFFFDFSYETVFGTFGTLWPRCVQICASAWW